MENITIKVTKNEVEYTMSLRPPTFDELSTAYNAYMSGFSKDRAGVPDLPKSGKVLIDRCCDDSKTDKIFFSVEGASLMLSAALKAAELVETFDAELKKN